MKFATKKKTWRLKQQTNKYRQSNNVQQANYNSEVQRQLQDEIAKPTWDPALTFESFSDILQKAADKCLTKIPVSMKKHYLTEKTWQLIEEKQTALEKSLKKEIRKHARIDKEKSLGQELEEIDRDGYKWDGLKKTRKTFQSKREKYRDKDGNLIKEKDFAEAAAKYFAEEQWAQPQNNNLDHSKENRFLIEGESNI